MMSETPWLTGQLLLALPTVGDPRFERSVIAMVDHGPGGAMGIGVNGVRRDMAVADIFDQLGIDHDHQIDQPVLVGGPVEPERGFVLHSRDWGGAGTIDVAGLWSVSSSHDILRAIAAGKGPARWQFALGYAGWGLGQLEGEFARHGWHAAPADETLIFDGDPATRWQAAYASLGIDTHLLSATAGAA